MKLVLSKPKYLKESISIINELVIESRLLFKHTGLEIISMDAANIAMVIFKLLKSSFITYNLEKEFDVGVKLSELKEVFRRVSEDDIVTIEFDDKLIVTSKGKTTKRFKIPIVDLEGEQKKSPDVKFDCIINTKSAYLSEAVDVCDIYKDDISIRISTKPDRVKFEVNEPGVEVYSIIKTNKETKINTKVDVNAKFSKSYMKKFILGSKLSDEVTIELKTDFPMKITYKVPDKVSLSFIIAPRVENK